MPHELSLTIGRKTKIRNAFANNIPAYIKLSKAQLSKIIQSGKFLDTLLWKLAGPLMKNGVLLTKLFLPLATMASVSAIDSAFQRKICRQKVVMGKNE